MDSDIMQPKFSRIREVLEALSALKCVEIFHVLKKLFVALEAVFVAFVACNSPAAFPDQYLFIGVHHHVGFEESVGIEWG